eukprot:jgi/Mesvir1/17821/Mv12916-RA.1
MAHLRVQHQIRENNMEVMDFMRELEAWEKTVKSKDISIRQPQATAADESMPPVRGHVNVDLEASAKALEAREKKKKKKQKKKPLAPASGAAPSKSQSAAGHTYDYFRDKWDKFDVDKALREADSSSASASSDDSGDDSPRTATSNAQAAAGMPPPRSARPAEGSGARDRGEGVPGGNEGGTSPEESAEYFKEQGNLLFKKAMYEEAVDYYMRSLRKKKTAVVLANAAMANLKLDRLAAGCRHADDTLPPVHVRWMHV